MKCATTIFEFGSGLHNFRLQGYTPAFSLPAVEAFNKKLPFELPVGRQNREKSNFIGDGAIKTI
jgi:hypothetical protein